MNELRSLSKLVFVFISVATIAACTTAPNSLSNIISVPKAQEQPPVPAPEPEPLTTKADGEISHDGGVVVAIPANLTTAAKRSNKKRSSKKKAMATPSAAPAAATANSSDVGQGFRALESAGDCCGTGCATPCLSETSGGGGTVVNITNSGDIHRALEGSDDCCGTGCSQACSIEQ